MQIRSYGALLLLGAMSVAACNNSAQTNNSANAAETANQAAREAAREMHNQMSANEMEDGHHFEREGTDGMHDMGNMQTSSKGNMQGNSMTNSMPMKDDSDDM